MGYSLNINGTEYVTIQGTEDWEKIITRDFNDRIFRTVGDFTFTGWDSLFNLIYNSTNTNGACVAIDSRIYFRENPSSAYSEWWRGQIKPQDCNWDLLNESVDTQVLDDLWASRFNNSQDQKVFLRSTKSKNNIPISQCQSNLCKFYDPADSVLANYAYTDRQCFRIFDVFTFLVDYHSDGIATFTSDHFDIGGDGDQYYITTGQEIREGANWVNPEVSFSEVFDEMHKKCNIWIIIETDDFDNPVLRIEPQDYVFQNVKVVDVENPESVNMKIDLDQLYTIIEVGSNATKYDNTNNANYPDVRFDAWTDESYNTAGDCEFENNTLDLVSTWKIDTNSIELALSGDDTNDDNIFLVEIDPTGPDYDAFKFTTDYTSSDTVEYIYNFNLTNAQVIDCWFDGIPQAIQKDLVQDVYAYVIDPTGGPIGGGPYGSGSSDMRFDNDSTLGATDPDDIYTTPAEGGGPLGVTTGMFQIGPAGWYRFTASINITSISGGVPIGLTVYVYEDSTRAVRIGYFLLAHSTTVGNLFGSVLVYMPVNSAAWVRVDKTGPGGYSIDSTGYCEVTSIERGDFRNVNRCPILFASTMSLMVWYWLSRIDSYVFLTSTHRK